jgi:metal-responsive CopG/Arc/MetJ family transcriptional regulator
MGRTVKLTVSLPQELIVLADKIAMEKKISRSKVVADCLQDMAEKQRATEMAEGYMALAEEQRQFTAMASKITPEVLPDWK